ncbi:multidrug ABC transporter permease [Bacillus pseudomycoides]|uniref:Multidrug ABC transporter permease n=1 Tax=Bacillus pseudomycoides TaxID=64104 RepID=A0AA91ZSU5_9BACI|nr:MULTISPECIES: MFS transporter [Bacillus]PEB51894.1 multidrug ABC transporter permease [Bacillus sp. AFS098217]PED81819.1 multidrug ABC transporter permease [Bacillus pseudomycoides]PEU15247.1 multidrug ABC transporter permease [Bacillus sp. AFS014408]PEU17850.1 multidrug ABC transporter permease [Bacillus sp. AFS019443]PFW63353.1 multidrug ABC transporter permease [Bacillus sp. AFS075034]
MSEPFISQQVQPKYTSISLFKNRAFLFLWLSSTTSFLALSTYLFAEQWYVIRALGQESALGIVMMVTMVPRVLLMTVGGVWADRFKRSKIMLVSSFTRCLLIFVMITLLHLHLLNLWSLLVFALLFGILDAFFSPANQSLLPLLVPKEMLTRSNSFIQTSNQIAMFAGPMIGGWIITTSSFSSLFFSVACFLVISCTFTLCIKEKKLSLSSEQASAKQELLAGFQYVWNMPFLKSILFILMTINVFFFGPLLMGIPLLANEVLHGKAVEVSFLQSSYQGGMLGGALLIGLLNIRKKRGLSILILISFLGISLSFLGQIYILSQGIILLVMMGFMSSMINIPLVSIIQENSETDKLGRVMSFVSASSNGLVPLSYAFVSICLTFGTPISDILLYCGCLITISSFLFLIKCKIIRDTN